MGKTAERAKIEKFLRRQIYGRRSEGVCERVELRHLSVGKNRGQEVQIFHLQKRMEEKDTLDLAQNIDDCAQEDANGMGALQRYVLLAFFADEDSAKGRLVFRKSSESEDEDSDPIDSEPATKGGLIAQQMRHNEIIMRSSNFAMGSVLNALQRDNQELRNEVNQMRQERRDSIEAYEKILSLQHERELQTKQHEFMLKAKEQMFDKISLLMPALVNRMAGKKVMPEKTTPESMAIKALMDSITSEQFAKLQEVFNPDQAVSLMQIFEANRDKDDNGVQRALTNGAS